MGSIVRGHARGNRPTTILPNHDHEVAWPSVTSRCIDDAAETVVGEAWGFARLDLADPIGELNAIGSHFYR